MNQSEVSCLVGGNFVRSSRTTAVSVWRWVNEALPDFWVAQMIKEGCNVEDDPRSRRSKLSLTLDLDFLEPWWLWTLPLKSLAFCLRDVLEDPQLITGDNSSKKFWLGFKMLEDVLTHLLVHPAFWSWFSSFGTHAQIVGDNLLDTCCGSCSAHLRSVEQSADNHHTSHAQCWPQSCSQKAFHSWNHLPHTPHPAKRWNRSYILPLYVT